MPSVRRTATLLPMFAVCVLAVAGVAPPPGVARAESPGAAAPRDSSALEASLVLDQPTRRPIQQGLRNAGFDPGTPDGLFDPRPAAGQDWQQSRGARPTGYLNAAEADLLRTAATTPPAATAPSTAPQAAHASAPSAASPTAPPASKPLETDSGPAPATVATRVVPQNAAETHTQQETRLPPEILIDRHLVRAERLLADGAPAAALEEMNEALALLEEHDLRLEVDFHFRYAHVAFAAGGTESAIAALNEYLLTAGRNGEFYRAALELLDSVDVRLERKEAELTRPARWPPGHVFRDCEVCPQDGGDAKKHAGSRPLRADGSENTARSPRPPVPSPATASAPTLGEIPAINRRIAIRSYA